MSIQNNNMKNTTAIVALSSFFIFSACKKTEQTKPENTTQTEQTAQPEKFQVDSVKVDDSIKIGKFLSLRYTSKLLVFPGIKDQKLLDSIYLNNKESRDFSKNGLQAYLEKEKKQYFTSMEQDTKDFISDITNAQTWYTDSDMKLVSNTNDYMHIQYSSNAYIGGAHDEYGYVERVFDLKNNRKVELKDITTISKSKLEPILMKNINKVPSGTTDEKGEVKNSEMLLVDVIPVSNNFYFDDKNLYFHYSPYEITAFAAGDIIIPVSWEDLKGTLTPEFKERMKIK